MNKRFASLAVSALLLVSLLSVPALAEGTEAAADAAGDDHVIVTLNPGRLPCSRDSGGSRGFCHRDGSG